MKLYLAFYENESEFYQYSIHRSEMAAEAAARAMLMDEMKDHENGAPDADLGFDDLVHRLADDNGHCLGVCLLELEDVA